MKHRAQKYEPLIDFLLVHNKTLNLTAIRNKEDALVKHIEDSLIASDYIRDAYPKANSIIDLGTGAGFPGLIIASEAPSLNVTLLDGTNKKIQYVKKAISFLEIKNASAVPERSESFSLSNKHVFDIVIARSVARLDILLGFAEPLLKNRGILLAMKSIRQSDELSLGQQAAKLHGFTLINTFPYTLLDQDRAILAFQKGSVHG